MRSPNSSLEISRMGQIGCGTSASSLTELRRVGAGMNSETAEKHT